MPTGIWTSFLLVLAGGTTLAWLVVRVHEGGIRPVRGLVAFFGRQSKTGRVLLGTFFLVLWIIAGTKQGGSEESRPYTSLQTRVGFDGGGTNDVQTAAGPGGGLPPSALTGSTATDALHAESQNGFHSTEDGETAGTETADDGRTDSTPITSTNTAQADATPAASANANASRTLTAEDFARGFVMHRVGTGEAFDFAAPPGVTVCADWEAFGAAEDWFYLSFTNWPRIAGNGNATAEEELAPSRFWHFVTLSNTLLLTWQNVLFGRRADAPLSFQAELWPEGRFMYRYNLSRCGGAGRPALPEASSAGRDVLPKGNSAGRNIPVAPNNTLTNVLVGAERRA